jgi:hypothetical protein
MARLEIYRQSLKSEGSFYFPSSERLILRFDFSLNNGSTFSSEWAPFPSIHSHTIDDVVQQSRTIESNDIEALEGLIGNNNSEVLSHFFRESFPYPLSFIMSLGLFHAQIKTAVDSGERVKHSVLLLPHHSISDALYLLGQGFSCLKIKVSSLISQEVERLNAIRSAIGDNIPIRIDANRKLSFDEAKLLLSHVKNLQYIEEPTYELSRLAELYDATGVAIALDESFLDGDSLDKLLEARARYLIIKASRFNNIFSLINLSKEAQNIGITPIFSHCFESDFYASLMSRLVKHLGLCHEAHGLYSNIFSASKT